MAAITSTTESWNGHSFSEVETHLKGYYIKNTSTEQTIESTIGTMNKGIVQFYRTGNAYCMISFANQDSSGTKRTLGYLGFTDNNVDIPYLYTTSGKLYKLWHEGNLTPSNYSLTSHTHDYSNTYAAKSHTHSYLPLSGGNMTGNISYAGTMATYPMIKWINNTTDNYGNGISIGGGGATVVGGGESSDVMSAQLTSGGDERLMLGNDGSVEIYTNLQDGWASRKSFTFNTDGSFSIGNYTALHTGNSSHTHSNYSLTSHTHDYSSTYAAKTHTHSYLPLSGGTMTGSLNARAGAYNYTSDSSSYGINLNNSDLVGVNGLFTNDTSDGWTEGINFKRTNGNWDSLRALDGLWYIHANNDTPTNLDVGLAVKGSTYQMDFLIGSGNVNRGIYNRTGSAWMLYFDASNTYCNYGSFISNGGVTALSDARHKKVVKDIDITVSDIASMPNVLFKWTDRDDNELHAGTLAQSWESVLPQAIVKTDNEEGTLSFNYGVAALVSSITTARKVVDHEKEIKSLKAKINVLEERISELEG